MGTGPMNEDFLQVLHEFLEGLRITDTCQHGEELQLNCLGESVELDDTVGRGDDDLLIAIFDLRMQGVTEGR